MHSSAISFISFIIIFCLLSPKKNPHENAACGDYMMKKEKFLRALEILFVWEHFVKGLVRIALPSGESLAVLNCIKVIFILRLLLFYEALLELFLLLSLHT